MRGDCALCDIKTNKCNALTRRTCRSDCTFFETKEDFELRHRSFQAKQNLCRRKGKSKEKTNE